MLTHWLMQTVEPGRSVSKWRRCVCLIELTATHTLTSPSQHIVIIMRSKQRNGRRKLRILDSQEGLRHIYTSMACFPDRCEPEPSPLSQPGRCWHLWDWQEVRKKAVQRLGEGQGAPPVGVHNKVGDSISGYIRFKKVATHWLDVCLWMLGWIIWHCTDVITCQGKGEVD